MAPSDRPPRRIRQLIEWLYRNHPKLKCMTYDPFNQSGTKSKLADQSAMVLQINDRPKLRLAIQTEPSILGSTFAQSRVVLLKPNANINDFSSRITHRRAADLYRHIDNIIKNKKDIIKYLTRPKPTNKPKKQKRPGTRKK